MRQDLLLPIGPIKVWFFEALQSGQHRRLVCAHADGRRLQPGLSCSLLKRITQPAVILEHFMGKSLNLRIMALGKRRVGLQLLERVGLARRLDIFAGLTRSGFLGDRRCLSEGGNCGDTG